MLDNILGVEGSHEMEAGELATSVVSALNPGPGKPVREIPDEQIAELVSQFQTRSSAEGPWWEGPRTLALTNNGIRAQIIEDTLRNASELPVEVVRERLNAIADPNWKPRGATGFNELPTAVGGFRLKKGKTPRRGIMGPGVKFEWVPNN